MAVSSALIAADRALTKSEFTGYLKKANFEILESHPLFAERMIFEEFPIYEYARRIRGSRFIRGFVRKLFRGRDGHMLMVVAQKPLA